MVVLLVQQQGWGAANSAPLVIEAQLNTKEWQGGSVIEDGRQVMITLSMNRWMISGSYQSKRGAVKWEI